MTTHDLFIQYGVSMIPVVVKALKDRRAGLKLLYDFLPHAKDQMSRERHQGQSRRSSLNNQDICRRDRISVGHYFDLARRSNQALEAALASLESYLDRQDVRHLDQALRHFEKSERLQDARIRTRIALSPGQNHAIALAG